MSLFGDDEDTETKKRQSSLFTDSPSRKANGGLFGDETDPWIPKPKRRRDPSQLLAESDIPDAYIDAFERYAERGQLSQTALSALRTDSKITTTVWETILSLVFPSQTEYRVERRQFYVIFLLIAVAQQDKELTLDVIDDLKSSRLPVPVLASPDAIEQVAIPTSESSTQEPPSQPSYDPQQTTLDAFLDLPSQNDAVSSQTTATPRKTSPLISRKEDVSDPWSPNGSQAPSFNTLTRPANNSYSSNAVINQYTLEIDGVLVRALEGKEGLPLWKHINYEIKCARRKSQVVRRYSDFAWLLDCLLKKYPFRQVPLLPPKKIAGMNITGKSADLVFLEKRRRGLSRFVNTLERHPIFKSDQLVTTFLTELAVWRKQASVSIQEEFEDRYLPAELEAGLPPHLDAWMTKTQLALRTAIDAFSHMTTLQERMLKRSESECIDRARFADAISVFAEAENKDYPILGSDNGAGIARGLQVTSKHYNGTRQAIVNANRAYEDTYLEDMKRYRGILSAMNELFIRHARYSGDDVPGLEKRIASNQQRLEVLKAKPEAKETDKEKLETSIKADSQSIIKAMNRRVFIRECVWHELQYFEAQQIHISKLMIDMSQLNLDSCRKFTDLASQLAGDLEGMPL